MSPLPELMASDVPMSATVMSPFSLRTVTADLVGTTTSISDADARITAGGLHVPTVAILHDFDIGAAGEAIGIALIPAADIFLAVDADLGLAAGTHADVAMRAFDGDARVRRNIFGRDVEIDRSGLAHHVGEVFFHAFDTGDDADQREQAENEKNFAGRDARAAGIAARGTRGSALIKFQRAPNDQEQRPPVNEKLAEFKSAIIVEQQQDADDDENQAAENAAAASATVGHGGYCPWPGYGL